MIPTYKMEDFPSHKTLAHFFRLERFEDLSWPKDLQWPHKHDFYEIIWVTEGTFTHTIDYHDIFIQTGTLLITAPGQIHLLHTPEKVKGYSIAFTEQFLLAHHTQESVFELTFLEDSFTKPYLCLDESMQQELRAIIDPLTAELDRPVKVPLIINGLLFVLLNRIQRFMHNDPVALKDTFQVVLLKRFKKLIAQHYREATPLTFYADKLHISANYLNKIVRQLTGKTAGEMIRDRGLIEAKRMLVYCNLPIGDISDQLGFKDFSYFSRQFKKQEGVSPAAYRKRMHEKYLNR
ncbi:AraC family transcriptional regulator [Chitinophaga nivalis]|uniref:Helix-turn-helix transcriptional regulator n=1 Tax=Chitinophaga nivalis TaxID=2991709 RepID=A0ABT3IPD6_9BACT|nr:helix-turn-helix transcriptional regulator [Chitinophaga nivalis]MCW3464471.1 helix-turn-helix transcriptional regulator [Chitinophaga nivalis]MCW3485838.1 helix-turn-helix transcriptional regulator [Chitinophaga nivalis]